MAMTMNGEVQLPASREVVWAKLNDPEVLKACIPGCEELEKTDEHGFRAVAKMKVGPVSARFKGKVTLSDLDPPNGYKISGEGEGGVAGFAKGGAAVKLAEKDGGTLLSYDVEAQIGGKLAQLGQRLINGTAKKLADEDLQKFLDTDKPTSEKSANFMVKSNSNYLDYAKEELRQLERLLQNARATAKKAPRKRSMAWEARGADRETSFRRSFICGCRSTFDHPAI